MNDDQWKNLDPAAKAQPLPWFKKAVQKYLVVFLILVAFAAGVLASNAGKQSDSNPNLITGAADQIKNLFAGIDGVDPELFSQAWETLHQYYIDRSQLSEKDLFYGAIGGMIEAAGDPYTIFLDPQITSDFTRELEGTFYGIGAEIGRKEGFLVIIAPLPGTPAEKAGLKPGDRILAIDGEESSDLSVDQAVAKIRGDKGEAVTLLILSNDEQAPRDVSVVRDKIEIPSVIYEVQDNIALINITSFNLDTDERFKQVAQQVLRDNPQGIILDLRNNPGGYLDVAVDIAGSWLDDDQVVVREIFSDQRESHDYKSTNGVDLSKFKTVVLVNEGSASASEILAGALQDYDIAQIVGQTTFGKGSVQQLYELKDGSSIKITVAKWLTPDGRTINETGIEPDTIVDYTTEDYNNEVDPQLDKAKELILQ